MLLHLYACDEFDAYFFDVNLLLLLLARMERIGYSAHVSLLSWLGLVNYPSQIRLLVVPESLQRMTGKLFFYNGRFHLEWIEL